MPGKTYRKTKEQAPTKAVDLTSAVGFIKEHVRKSFNETIELHVRLGIDTKKSDQTVRGNVVLPGGSPKQKRIVVFAASAVDQKAAQLAGATLAGGEDLIDKIAKEGKLSADLTVAVPTLMPKIAKIARILGPQGLMPNPKTGTVSPDPAGVVKKLMAGQASFKMDQQGNIHEAIGKADWEEKRIIANATVLLDAIRAARPTTAKGEFIKSVTLSSTMGPGIKIAN
ncbi:MAG: 50S ribosomal protein L1 [bacterium]|nr:50S ribosomal protein L1 [bacterium]